jgi:hypothetical protein
MDLLKEICESYAKWKPLDGTLVRIETYRDSDGALVLESCKSLIESICRTILEDLEETPSATESLQSLVSKTCEKMGCLSNTKDLVRSFVTVAQRLGEFRNDFAVVGHGASVYQLEERRSKITKVSTYFMISTVEQLAVFLIAVYQEEYPLQKQAKIRHEDNPDFNAKFDELVEPINIGDYGPYSPSELLFNIDIDAYKTELSKSIDEQ